MNSTSLLVGSSISIVVNRSIKALAILDNSLLDVKTATTGRSTLDELLLSLLTLLHVVVDEILRHVRLLGVVLANKDWLQAEFVKSLQVTTA